MIDQLGGGLDADARHARHVVGGIAGQGLHFDDLVGQHAEFFHDLIGADGAVLHGIEHGHAGADQLHHILVGGDHDDVDLCGLGHLGVGGDEIVGLEAFHLQAADIEGARGVADDAELRHQFFRRLGPVGFIFFVNRVAEGQALGVEDHGDEFVDAVVTQIVQQLHQHVGKAVDGVDRRAVGPGHGRQGVEGAEDVSRAVDQVEPLGRRGGFSCHSGKRAGALNAPAHAQCPAAWAWASLFRT